MIMSENKKTSAGKRIGCLGWGMRVLGILFASFILLFLAAFTVEKITLAQLPQIEAKLQALSFELIQVAKTNAAAAQIVREFSIQWTPPAESYLAPPASLPPLPAPETPAPATVPPAMAAPAAGAPATNVPTAK